MVSFTGTSTGKTYSAGSYYTSAGDVYRANEDGTFTNQRSGYTNVGSSQDPRVQWSGPAQSLSSGGGSILWSNDSQFGGGPGNAGGGASGGVRSGGPGNGAASLRGSVSAEASSGVGFAGSGQATFRGSTLAPLSVSGGGDFRLGVKANGKPLDPMVMHGIPMVLDQTTTSANVTEDRWGDGEFLSPAWFWNWGVAGADVVSTAWAYGDAHGKAIAERAWAIEQEMNDYRENGVMAPMGAPASLNW